MTVDAKNNTITHLIRFDIENKENKKAGKLFNKITRRENSSVKVAHVYQKRKKKFIMKPPSFTIPSIAPQHTNIIIHSPPPNEQQSILSERSVRLCDLKFSEFSTLQPHEKKK